MRNRCTKRHHRAAGRGPLLKKSSRRAAITPGRSKNACGRVIVHRFGDRSKAPYRHRLSLLAAMSARTCILATVVYQLQHQNAARVAPHFFPPPVAVGCIDFIGHIQTGANDGTVSQPVAFPRHPPSLLAVRDSQDDLPHRRRAWRWRRGCPSQTRKPRPPLPWLHCRGQRRSLASHPQREFQAAPAKRCVSSIILRATPMGRAVCSSAATLRSGHPRA